MKLVKNVIECQDDRGGKYYVREINSSIVKMVPVNNQTVTVQIPRTKFDEEYWLDEPITLNKKGDKCPFNIT